MSEKKEGKEESEDGKRKEKGGNRKCGRRRRDIIERLLLLPLLPLHEWTCHGRGRRGGQQEGCNFFGRRGCKNGVPAHLFSSLRKCPLSLAIISFQGRGGGGGGPLGHVLPHPGGSTMQRNFVRL